MASTLPMVLATWSRLVPATRDPPVTRSDWTRSRFVPPGPITVCGPGLAATLATVGDRNQDTPPAGLLAATCRFTQTCLNAAGYPGAGNVPFAVSFGPANLSFAQPWGAWGYLGAAAVVRSSGSATLAVFAPPPLQLFLFLVLG